MHYTICCSVLSPSSTSVRTLDTLSSFTYRKPDELKWAVRERLSTGVVILECANVWPCLRVGG